MQKQSKRRLVALLAKIGQAEKQIELLREVLCSQNLFEPYMLFKALDGRRGYILATDLHALLAKHKVQCDLDDVMPVVNFYCQRGDGKLRYTDFMQFVLTTNNLQLRAIVTQRPTFESNEVPYDVEYGLMRIVQREVEMFAKLNVEKVKLAQLDDFTYRTAFSTIDCFHNNTIQPDHLSNFLVSHDIHDKQLHYAIFKRLDHNRDNSIDLEDFTVALEPHQGVQVSRLVTKAEEQRTPTTPSLQKSFSSNVSQTVEYPNRRSMVSVQKHVTKMRQVQQQRSPRSQRQPKPNSAEELLYLVESLRIIAKLEHESELMRESLTLQQDCNILDIFDCFDIDNSVKLCPSDISNTLEQLKLTPTQTQMFMWVKRYDQDRDGKLNVREFLNALLPVNQTIAEKAKQRASATLKKRKVVQLHQVMSAQTLQRLTDMFRCQIENEVAIECVRQKLSRRPNFNVKKLFKAIVLDTDGDGYFDIDDLRRLLEDNGIVMEPKELQLLMVRFDRNEDERVSYAEFLQEIHPKSSTPF